MDVRCSTCEAVWDTPHLYHDAIRETGLSVDEVRRWYDTPRAGRLSPRYREEFKKVGWKFGRSIVNVVHCPRCTIGAVPNPVRLTTKASLEALIADDDVTLACVFNSYRL